MPNIYYNTIYIFNYYCFNTFFFQETKFYDFLLQLLFACLTMCFITTGTVFFFLT